MYDQVACSQITLANKGRVGFEFEALNMEPCASGKPSPGAPLLIPHKVSVCYSPHIDSPYVDSLHIDSPHIASPYIVSPCIDSPYIDSPYFDSSHISY